MKYFSMYFKCGWISKEIFRMWVISIHFLYFGRPKEHLQSFLNADYSEKSAFKFVKDEFNRCSLCSTDELVNAT